MPEIVRAQTAGAVSWEGPDARTSPHAIEQGPQAVEADRIGRISKAVPLLGMQIDELQSGQRKLEDGHKELAAGQKEQAKELAQVAVAVARVAGGQDTLVNTLAADRLERERRDAADRAERDTRAAQAVDLTKTRIAAAPKFWKAIIGAIAAGVVLVIAALLAHGCS